MYAMRAVNVTSFEKNGYSTLLPGVISLPFVQTKFAHT